mmetsp:Transcript_35945/g.55228  ORF Transcript_35945/g.55228 Transcript_35945/m.55228 type:complete len:230 (-) Transcript_35945:685-1374(-)
MVLTLDIDQVDVVLEEMAVLLLRNLDVLAVLIQVDSNSILAKLRQQLVHRLSLLVRQLLHVLVGCDRGIEAFVSSNLHFESRIESIEEGLEVNIFSVFNHSSNTSSLGLVVSLQEALSNDQGILLLFGVSSPSDPDVDVLVQFKDEGVVGIQVLSLQGSVLNFGTEELPGLIRNLEEFIVQIVIFTIGSSIIRSRRVDRRWLSSEVAPELSIDTRVLPGEKDVSLSMSL